MYGGDKKCMQNFGGETCNKKSLEIRVRRWQNNVKMGRLRLH
jgi:hypothetical protein